MPREGYRTVGKNSLPDELIEAIDKLRKNPKYIREMRLRGFRRISRALVIRMALLDYLADKGIIETSETEGK